MATETKDAKAETAANVEAAQKEAYEYWGYLFRPDKTATDKLKSLLRGLKDLIVTRYDRSEQPDLTPNQLAQFYRRTNQGAFYSRWRC